MPLEAQANPEQRAQLAAHLIAQMRASSCSPKPAGGRERFMLFAAPLVTAILEGRKTVTRRLVSPAGVAVGACPFGAPGDRLWVREKWGYQDEFFDGRGRGGGRVVYATDGAPTGATRLAWRPSLHMPRTACRLELQVTSVRSEPLTALTPNDAAAEGCPLDRLDDPVSWFRETWDTFYAARGAGWRDNPWVWVLSFRRAKVETL